MPVTNEFHLFCQLSLLFCSFLATKSISAIHSFTSHLLFLVMSYLLTFGSQLPLSPLGILPLWPDPKINRNESTLNVARVLWTVILNLKYSAWCSQLFIAWSCSTYSKFISYPTLVLIYLFTDPWLTRLKLLLNPSFEQSVASSYLLSLYMCFHGTIITWYCSNLFCLVCIYVVSYTEFLKVVNHILNIFVFQPQGLYLLGIQ